jgi:molybdopterin molybdotransferase
MLGIPILKKMSGQKLNKNNYIPIKVNFNHTKKAGRKEFLRVKLSYKDNNLILNKFNKEGAGILSSTSWATGLGIIDEDIEILKKHDKINYISLSELLS